MHGITPIYAIRVVGHTLLLAELVLTAGPGPDLMTGNRRAALPRAIAFRYLTTLEELGHIEWDVSASTAHLGLNLLQLGRWPWTGPTSRW